MVTEAEKDNNPAPVMAHNRDFRSAMSAPVLTGTLLVLTVVASVRCRRGIDRRVDN